MSDKKGNTERIPIITDDIIKKENEKKTNTIKPKKLTNNVKYKKETKDDRPEIEKDKKSFNPIWIILLAITVGVIIFLILINRDNNRRTTDYLQNKNSKLEEQIENYKGSEPLPSQEELQETNQTLQAENRQLADDKAKQREKIEDLERQLKNAQLDIESEKSRASLVESNNISQSDYDYIKSQYDSAVSENNDLRQKLSEANSQIENISNSSVSQEDLNARDRDIQTLRSQLDNANKIINQKDAEIQKLQTLSSVGE
jgi:hypothetical protein